MNAAPRSHFTPSLMSADLLERLFVARDELLDDIVDRARRAATSQERNHTLVIGPRGAGKTHLVSLAHHRIRALVDGGARLQTVWLPEDPWTIASYRHLLGAILDGLGVPPATTADQREHQIAAAAQADGPVVVLLENLDQVLHQIGDEGQQRLRHLVQADRSVLLVATTTRLDRSLSDQASPFYAFFTTSRLTPFDVDQAASMLTRIAQENGQDDLVDYLASDQGLARLRAVAHLAGGQPRMWSLLSSSLSVEGLSELVEHLVARVDDLTPYYQEQLARLSTHQRLVVAELAEADHPLHVRELAGRVEIDQRSVGRTMVDLVDRGWAIEISSEYAAALDRRRTYYELAEPMARLAFQVKEGRGGPIRVVVDFLKHWFDRPQLEGGRSPGALLAYSLAALEAQGDPAVSVTRYLHDGSETDVASLQLLGDVDDALAKLPTDAAPLMALPTPVRSAVEHAITTADALFVRRDLLNEAFHQFVAAGGGDYRPWVERATHAYRASRQTDRPFLLSGTVVAWLELTGDHAAGDAIWAEAQATPTGRDALDVVAGCVVVAVAYLITRSSKASSEVIDWAADLSERSDFGEPLTNLIADWANSVRLAYSNTPAIR